MERGTSLEALDLYQLRNVTLNDTALMRELPAALIDDTEKQQRQLRQALDAGDCPAAARIAHALTGSCGNVGAVSLAALFQDIDREAKAGRVEGCRAAAERVEQEIGRL